MRHFLGGRGLCTKSPSFPQSFVQLAILHKKSRTNYGEVKPHQLVIFMQLVFTICAPSVVMQHL